ncbi:MAG: hypothetical protein ACJA17_000186 [Polaribacter sp.]
MRVKIAIFFSILFISALMVPTLISQTDDFQEIAILLDMNEEEENKGKEEYKVDSKLKIWPQSFTSSISDNSLEITKNIQFYSKNYISRYPTITTPPPQ